MATYLFRIRLPTVNISSLFKTFDSIKYKLKQMGSVQVGSSIPTNQQQELHLTITMPRGKTHYTHCMDIFRQYGASLVNNKQGTLIALRARERFVEFLGERYKDALAIYFGTVAIVMGTLEIANRYFPNNEEETTHLIFSINAIDYSIMLALAGFPSIVHLLYSHGSFKKRYE